VSRKKRKNTLRDIGLTKKLAEKRLYDFRASDSYFLRTREGQANKIV